MHDAGGESCAIHRRIHQCVPDHRLRNRCGELQRPEHLTAIIAAVRSGGPRRPLLVKIAPDIDDVMLGEVCNVTRTNVDGMICTNRTIDRLLGMNESGGLSGKPLMAKSTAVLRRVRELVGREYPLIGVGGVFTSADVQAKFEAGADLVQIYTAFIYEGPRLPSRLAHQLVAQRSR